jgi:hypothetical protein
VALDTFTGLKLEIGDWLNRADLVAVIPTFITLAEAGLNRTVRVRQMIKRATATISQDFTSLPSDMLDAKNVQTNGQNGRSLEFVTLDRADKIRRQTPIGEPIYYTIVGGTLELVPVPSGATEVEITYYSKIPALSNTVASNWLLASSPDLYLYASLLQSAPYLRDDPRISIWGGIYSQLLADLKLANERAEYSGSPLKARGPLL